MINEFWCEFHKKELEYETDKLIGLIDKCLNLAYTAQQRILLAETLMAILDCPASCPEWSLEHIAREAKSSLRAKVSCPESHEEFLHKRNQIQERRKEVLVFVEVL